MKTAIILSSNKRLLRYVKSALSNYNVSTEQENPLLYDLNAIKQSIEATGNTAEVRQAFAGFIHKNKFPYILVLDFETFLGLDSEQDPDKRKLLRTFIIAFMILSQAKGLKNYHASLLLFAAKGDKQAMLFQSNFPGFIQSISTVNEKVNGIIQYFLNNDQALKDLFNIEVIYDPGTGVLSGQVDKIQNFIDDVEVKYNRTMLSEKAADLTPIDNATHTAARVLFKYNDTILFDDSGIRNIKDEQAEYAKYKERVVYVIGHFTNRIKNFVLKKIEMAVSQEISEQLDVKKTENLAIELTDETIIDGSTADALYNFLAKKFRGYNFQINVSEDNMQKLANSPHFDKLQDYIIKNL